MISFLFNTIFYNPLYNGLIGLIDIIPGGDVGVATIILTCIVKFILFPLSKKATKTQLVMKQLEPELARLREKYGSNKEELARQTLEFYRINGLNPFASFFLVLLQLPVILALAFVFYRGGLPIVHSELLYSFVHIPNFINTNFLGLFDITHSNLWLSIATGLAQFIQIRLSVPAYTKPTDPLKPGAFGDDLARSMNMQMRYVMPIFMFIVCLNLSGAIALYWITGSLFMIAQELYFRKTIKKNIVKV